MKIKSVLVSIAVCSLLFASCSNTSTSVSSSSASVLSSSATSTNPSAASVADTQTDTLLTLLGAPPATYSVENSSESPEESVRYAYPQLGGGSLSTDTATQVNAKLKEAAERLTLEYQDEEELQMEGTYQVYFHNENVVSVLYTNEFNYKDAANPGKNELALTIDLRNGEEVTLAQLYTVDQTFLDAIFTAHPDYEENMLSVQTDQETFLTALQNAGTEDEINAMFVLDTSDIIFIVPVTHVQGDYMNFPVSYKTLEANLLAK